MNVWVILGGMTAEREVSLASGGAVASALKESGHEVWVYDLRDDRFLPEHSSAGLLEKVPPDTFQDVDVSWAERLLARARYLKGRFDVAFLALHGGEGEGGAVQTLLSIAEMPFTGSGAAACALTLNKAYSKWIMESLEVPTPAWRLLSIPRDPVAKLSPEIVGFVPPLPVVVKPLDQGSSVGITIVERPEQWEPALRLAAEATEGRTDPAVDVLVEAFVPGRELTVAVLGNAPLPIVEIIPREGFYDYAHKYTEGASKYQVPAKIDDTLRDRLQDLALRLFEAMECRGFARIDFRLNPEGEAYCLEVNAIPGLTATSLVPKAAAAVGLGFGALLEEICRGAVS